MLKRRQHGRLGNSPVEGVVIQVNVDQRRFPIIALLTDFGHDSHYVAQMKGVILGLRHDARLVDVTHSIHPQDICEAAWVLSDVVGSFPIGTIFVVVVDPEVGSDRQLIAGTGNDQRIYIGPDNGLFSRCPESFDNLVSLDQPQFWRPNVSPTFHGRDIMSPVAAHLANGAEWCQLGTPNYLQHDLEMPDPVIDQDQRRIVGRIEYADSFGNLITNIPAVLLQSLSVVGDVSVSCGSHQDIPVVQHYSERGHGAVVGLIGSPGRLEIAVVDGNAHDVLQPTRHAAVECNAN